MLMLRNGVVCYQRNRLSLCDVLLARGEVVGLSGPSGVGKSTLAKVLAGIQPLSSGMLSVPERQKGQANPVQWVAQQPEFAFNPYLTVGQSLRESWRSEDFCALLDDYRICPSWLERYPQQLSGGQLQRLNVVRALIPSTQYLLCDEISAPLDLLTQKHLWQTLLGHCRARELGVLVISHDRMLLSQVCDRLLSY